MIRPFLALKGIRLGMSSKVIALACRLRIRTEGFPKENKLTYRSIIGHRNRLKLSIAETLINKWVILESLGKKDIWITDFRGVNVLDDGVPKFRVMYFKIAGDYIKLKRPVVIRSI